MGKNLYTLFIIALSIASCDYNNDDNIDGIHSFCISSNDSFLIVAYEKDNTLQLYKYQMHSKAATRFINESSFGHPLISNNNNRVLLINYDTTKVHSSLWLGTADQPLMKKLVDGDIFINEAIFSNSLILYTQAREYTNYSPVARKSLHKFDVYSFDLDNQFNKKITDIDAYAIYGITAIDSNNILCRIDESEASGLYFINIQEGHISNRFVPKNCPRDSDLYYNPYYSTAHKSLFFEAPYELYYLSFSDSIAKKIFTNPPKGHIYKYSVFNNSARVAVIHSSERDIIDIYDFSGSIIDSINIREAINNN